MNIKKFIRSFGFAIEGLKLAVMVDQNVRFHLIVGILVFITAILLKDLIGQKQGLPLGEVFVILGKEKTLTLLK